MTKEKLIIIAGPTGIGKSSLAIKLAKEFNGEIIGADSMQIYSGMDIGTGKTPIEQRCGLVHRMIDVLEPNLNYSVGAYSKAAKAAISQSIANGKLPFLVGGTGLYISSLLSNLTFSSTKSDENLRKQLDGLDNEALFNRLKNVDEISAQKISINDRKRMIRALEIFYISGKPKSQQADLNAESNYDYLLFVLTAERGGLYKKIELRVDEMIKSGLVEEVKTLVKKCSDTPIDSLQSTQAIGYKELIEYIDGKTTLADAIEKLKTNTRRYAKRQITYFKNMPLNKEFLDVDDENYLASIKQKITLFINNERKL